MKIRALNAVAHHVSVARRRTRFSTLQLQVPGIKFIVHATIFPLQVTALIRMTLSMYLERTWTSSEHDKNRMLNCCQFWLASNSYQIKSSIMTLYGVWSKLQRFVASKNIPVVFMRFVRHICWMRKCHLFYGAISYPHTHSQVKYCGLGFSLFWLLRIRPLLFASNYPTGQGLGVSIIYRSRKLSCLKRNMRIRAPADTLLCPLAFKSLH